MAILNRIKAGNLLAIVGIIDTLILINETYSGSDVCIGATKYIFNYPIDCGYVVTTKYAEFFGIPLAVLGFIYYSSIISLLMIEREDFTSVYSKILVLFTSVGLMVSLYLIYLQLAVIGYICTYCMISATTSILLFLYIILSRFFKLNI